MPSHFCALISNQPCGKADQGAHDPEIDSGVQRSPGCTRAITYRACAARTPSPAASSHAASHPSARHSSCSMPAVQARVADVRVQAHCCVEPTAAVPRATVIRADAKFSLGFPLHCPKPPPILATRRLAKRADEEESRGAHAISWPY